MGGLRAGAGVAGSVLGGEELSPGGDGAGQGGGEQVLLRLPGLFLKQIARPLLPQKVDVFAQLVVLVEILLQLYLHLLPNTDFFFVDEALGHLDRVVLLFVVHQLLNALLSNVITDRVIIRAHILEQSLISSVKEAHSFIAETESVKLAPSFDEEERQVQETARTSSSSSECLLAAAAPCPVQSSQYGVQHSAGCTTEHRQQEGEIWKIIYL